MSGQEFLILAAGRGTRFTADPRGGSTDKLRVRVLEESLPQRAVSFAAANGASRVLVTLAAGDAGDRVLADMTLAAAESGVELRARRQDVALYGPGAALLPWRKAVSGPLVVLFGDNLYQGLLPAFPDPDALYFTCSDLADDPRNLRFASVQGDRLVEKPHRFTSGAFFTGLLRLPAGFLDVASFTPSPRGEYEITELVNSWSRRVALRLDPATLLWDEITVFDDVARLEKRLATC